MHAPNATIEAQLNHRTIREFTDKPVAPEIIETLSQVARQTATSLGLQQASIIRITDPEIKKQIATACTQEYIGRAPELWVFLSDSHRNKQIATEKGAQQNDGTGLVHFFQGYSDACLMLQNVNVAAESLGLGTVTLGSIVRNILDVCSILNLPPNTLPVLALAFGEPNQEPQLKPRMPIELRMFENEYQVPESYLEELAAYDQEMTSYYDLRDANSRVDSFSDQVTRHYANSLPEEEPMLIALKSQGYVF